MCKKPVLAITISILLLAFMCGQQEESAYTIEIIGGVKHIHNYAPLWGDTLKVELEFVQKIGVLEGDDENYMFYRPIDVVKDDQGNIYVLDMGNYRIQKFDENGKYLATIGRKGEGPGELLFPTSMCINSENTIYVADITNRRIQKFSSAGKEKGIFRIKDIFQEIRILQSGEPIPQILVVFDPYIQDASGSLLAIANEGGEILKRFGKIYEYSNPKLCRHANKIFYDVDSDDNIVVAFRAENRINKYTPDGTCIFSADRRLRYKIENRIEKQRHDIQGKRQEFDILKLAYVTRGIGVDNKGRIWTVTFKQQPPIDEIGYAISFGGETLILEQPPEKRKLFEKPLKPIERKKFEIYNEDGILLERLPIPVLFSYMRIFGDRIYLIDLSEMCVYEYKIIEK